MKIRKESAESIFQILRASIVSLLVARAYLDLMNYPIVGGGVWHISHAFFGGMIMLFGVLMLVVYEGKNIYKLSLNIFGIGLGWFIDESGKYLTMDNNYFFRPTVMLVYIFFIGLFLIYKYLNIKTSNFQLQTSNKKNGWIKRLLTKKQVMVGLWVYSLYFSGQKISELFRIISSEKKLDTIKNVYVQYLFVGNSDNFLICLKIIFDTLAVTLFLLGAGYFWSKKRLRGLRFFQYGLYINIFLVTVLRFYFEQFGAIIELLLAVGLLEIIGQYKSEILKK